MIKWSNKCTGLMMGGKYNESTDTTDSRANELIRILIDMTWVEHVMFLYWNTQCQSQVWDFILACCWHGEPTMWASRSGVRASEMRIWTPFRNEDAILSKFVVVYSPVYATSAYLERKVQCTVNPNFSKQTIFVEWSFSYSLVLSVNGPAALWSSLNGDHLPT